MCYFIKNLLMTFSMSLSLLIKYCILPYCPCQSICPGLCINHTSLSPILPLSSCLSHIHSLPSCLTDWIIHVDSSRRFFVLPPSVFFESTWDSVCMCAAFVRLKEVKHIPYSSTFTHSNTHMHTHTNRLKACHISLNNLLFLLLCVLTSLSGE